MLFRDVSVILLENLARQAMGPSAAARQARESSAAARVHSSL